MKRRQFLVALGLSAGSGGCLSRSDSDPRTDRESCQVAKSRLAAERASLSSGQREHVLPIEFSSLSGAVREVFATVVDGGTVSTCPTKTATGTPERALSDALDLVEKRIDRQRGRYDGAGPTPEWVSHVAYLRRGDQYYVLSARLSDVAVSYGTPPQSAASGTDTASP